MAMRHFLESKVLALGVIILGLAMLISLLCSLLPFWFRLHFNEEDATYGSLAKREDDLIIGLYWVYKPDKPGPERTKVLMTSLTSMDEASNRPVVPPLFKMGQVFYSIGVFGISVGFAGALMLALRQLGSVTGNFALAIFTFLSAICQVLGVVLSLCTMFGDSTWSNLPLENPFRLVMESHPTMHLDWGFYIALIGAIVSVFGAVLIIIEALKFCKIVEDIRRHHRRTKAPEEPYPDIRYSRFSYADVPRPKPSYPPYSSPGVMPSRGPPQPQFIAQPQPSPQPPRYGGYSPQPMPPQEPMHHPPSYGEEKAYEAGFAGPREVNL